MTRVGEYHIMRTTLKGTVILHVHTAKCLPSHQFLRELKGTVFDELTI